MGSKAARLSSTTRVAPAASNSSMPPPSAGPQPATASKAVDRPIASSTCGAAQPRLPEGATPRNSSSPSSDQPPLKRPQPVSPASSPASSSETRSSLWVLGSTRPWPQGSYAATCQTPSGLVTGGANVTSTPGDATAVGAGVGSCANAAAGQSASAQTRAAAVQRRESSGQGHARQPTADAVKPGWSYRTAMPDVFDLAPKVELHLHLEGAIPPAALWALVQAYGDPDTPTLEAMIARFEYRDFAHFIETWQWMLPFIRTPADWTAVATAVATSLAEQHIVYAEASISPTDFRRHELPLAEVATAVRHGLDPVEAPT